MHEVLNELKILNMNLESAKVKDLRNAIAEAKAGGGTQKMNKADLIAHAEKVVAIRGDGYLGEINTENVDALMDVDELPNDSNVFEVAPDANANEVAASDEVVAQIEVAKPPESVSDEPVTVENTLDALRERVKAVLGGRTQGSPRASKPINATFVELFKNTIKDAAPDDNGVIIINTDMIRAAGWSPTYSKITNGWTRTKSAGRAAIECGFNTRTKRDGDTFIVICTPIKKPVVDEQPASADASE